MLIKALIAIIKFWSSFFLLDCHAVSTSIEVFGFPRLGMSCEFVKVNVISDLFSQQLLSTCTFQQSTV